jgi:hypothetical protein
LNFFIQSGAIFRYTGSRFSIWHPMKKLFIWKCITGKKNYIRFQVPTAVYQFFRILKIIKENRVFRAFRFRCKKINIFLPVAHPESSGPPRLTYPGPDYKSRTWQPPFHTSHFPFSTKGRHPFLLWCLPPTTTDHVRQFVRPSQGWRRPSPTVARPPPTDHALFRTCHGRRLPAPPLLWMSATCSSLVVHPRPTMPSSALAVHFLPPNGVDGKNVRQCRGANRKTAIRSRSRFQKIGKNTHGEPWRVTRGAPQGPPRLFTLAMAHQMGATCNY